MGHVDLKELLNVPEVIDEIKRHLWIESEKAGHDIGFDHAAQDWLNKYAKAWLDYYGYPKILKDNFPAQESLHEKKRRAKFYHQD